MSLLDQLKAEKLPRRFVALDSETRPFSAGQLDPPPACFSWCYDNFEPGLIHGNDAEDFLRDVLRRDTIVGANFAYDAAVIIKRYPGLIPDVFDAYNAGRILDVQIAQRLIDISMGRLGGYRDVRGFFVKYFYSLAELHERHGFGKLEKPAVRMEYGPLIDVPLKDWPEHAARYAKDDAVATLKVWQAQQQYSELLENLAAQTRTALGLHLISVVGNRTDGPTCDAYMAELKAEIEAARVALVKHGLVRKDGTKNTKAAKAHMLEVCQKGGIDLKPTDTALKRWRQPSQAQLIESGLYSLDAEACRDSGDSLLQSYCLFTSASGLLDRAETLKLGSTGTPLQPRYQCLQDNGRTSCTAPKAPLIGCQMQNLPREGKLRECFVPKPPVEWLRELGLPIFDEYVFCSVDFNGLEMCTFAQSEIALTGKSRMAEAINSGKDTHCLFVAAYLGCTYEEAFAGKKDKNSIYAQVRQKIAKAANFGLLGGMKAKRFMQSVNKVAKKPEDKIDLATAQRAIDAFFRSWACEGYFEVCDELLQDGGGSANIKQLVTGRVRGRLNYTTLRNGFFSGLANDAATATLLPLWQQCCDKNSPMYGSFGQIFLHDENVFALPAHTAHEAAFFMRDTMLEIAQQFLPDVRLSAEPAIMRRWYKNADKVLDASGKLTPWEPT